MDQIIKELDEIRGDGFALDFHYPTKEKAIELAVSTDAMIDDDEREQFEDLRAALRKAKGNWKQLPLDLRRELADLSGGSDE